MAVNIFSGANSNAKIYKNNGFSSAILDSFSSPSNTLSGVGWDGDNLLSADQASGKIYKHSGFTATVSDSFSSPSAAPAGLTWDGVNLFSSNTGVGQTWIIKHVGFSASIGGLMSAKGYCYGISWDGDLYQSETSYDKIYRHSGFSSTIKDSFSSPSTTPISCSWDGYNLLSGDYTLGKFYKHNGFTNSISDSFSSPSTNPWGPVWEFYAPCVPSVYDSIVVVEDANLIRIPILSNYESISIIESISLYLTILNLSVYETISIFDVFENESILNATIFDILSVLENLEILVSPAPSVFDSIAITEVTAFSDIVPKNVSVYDVLICLEMIDVRKLTLDRYETILTTESVTIDIKQYGIKVISPVDPDLFSLITPEVSTIISAGRITMPNSLNGDGTYGVDIELPDLGDVPLEDIGVIVLPVEFTYDITNIELVVSGFPQAIPYMRNGANYYEHNKSNGQMSVWVAGNLTDSDPTTFDHIAGMFPIAFWDIMGGTDFTKIRIFAGMCYLCYDSSTSTYKKVISIGSAGVSKVDYAVFVKRFNPQPKYVEIASDDLAIAEAVSLGVA